MAYDFGSSGLGITNPFKKEGLARTVGGLLISCLGFYSLFQITHIIETNMIEAWIYAIFGLVLLISGLTRCGSGLFQLFKFFVGRSIPSSLAYNQTKSESDNANLEKKQNALAYEASTLESMLMGRKNTTFKEPQGWMGRFVHSIFPKLIFLPYPIRNIMQEVVAILLTTFVALVAFGLTYFVSSSGLAGEAGHIIIPAFSVLLLGYLIGAWRKAASAVSLSKVKQLKSAGAGSLAKIIAFSIIFPVVIGMGYHFITKNIDKPDTLNQLFENAQFFSAWPSLILLFVLGAISCAFIIFMVVIRSQQSEPKTEVSEFRENLQESVHPNEVFINIENIVLANRRYKEIPNRTYLNFDPVLNEQSQGKGSFSGELLIETQPEFKPTEHSKNFKLVRLAATISAQVLLVTAAFVFFSLTTDIAMVVEYVQNMINNPPQLSGQQGQSVLSDIIAQGSVIGVGLITTLFMWQIIITIGRLMENFSHIFWAEMQFDSLLMYMKTEGTFAESKISTGMSIHDSTRSENVVVKSSITPWVVSSRITTSTFASSGNNNIEMQRYVMSMEKNESELQSIINEIRDFLKARENIAGFTNTADLQHAENILKVNQASRNTPEQLSSQGEAAGFLRNESDSQADNDRITEGEK
jgi:hypothetical protein